MIDNMYARLNNCYDITAINDVVHVLTSVLQNAADPIKKKIVDDRFV